MLIFYAPWDYLVGLGVWSLGLAVMLLVFLIKRRSAKKAGKKGRLRLWNAALSCWMLLAFLTGCEWFFAMFVDHSDAMNFTNVSKRWIIRHIDEAQNDAGFRDANEFTKTIPEGQKRICFFGDSFTAGHGVDDMSDRFTDLIGQRLEEVHPGQYIVANLGQLGYEVTLIESLVWGALREGHEIDMVIYVYMMNDIEGLDERTEEALEGLQQNLPESWLFRRTYFFNWLYFLARQATGPAGGGYFSHLVDSYESGAWDRLTTVLSRLNANCRFHRVEFRMVIFPFVSDLGPEYPFTKAHAKLVEFCQSEGIPVLDLEPVLTPHVDEGLKVNAYDAHPNERAHKIVAEAIEKHLLKDVFAGD